MSYYTAKKTYETEKQNSPDAVVYTCAVCFLGTEKDELIRFGTMCGSCFDNYCKSAPRYEPQPTFTGDSRDWARRILHKEKEGLTVSKIAVEFAKQALKID